MESQLGQNNVGHPFPERSKFETCLIRGGGRGGPSFFLSFFFSFFLGGGGWGEGLGWGGGGGERMESGRPDVPDNANLLRVGGPRAGEG